MTHEFTLRVYYEDTDLAGIVYYANYLKFIERGRSEWVRTLGVDQGALRAEAGIVFAVRRVEADYLRPAVKTALTTTARVRRAGKSVGVVDVDVFNDQKALVAIGRATYSTLAG